MATAEKNKRPEGAINSLAKVGRDSDNFKEIIDQMFVPTV